MEKDLKIEKDESTLKLLNEFKNKPRTKRNDPEEPNKKVFLFIDFKLGIPKLKEFFLLISSKVAEGPDIYVAGLRAAVAVKEIISGVVKSSIFFLLKAM